MNKKHLVLFTIIFLVFLVVLSFFLTKVFILNRDTDSDFKGSYDEDRHKYLAFASNSLNKVNEGLNMIIVTDNYKQSKLKYNDEYKGILDKNKYFKLTEKFRDFNKSIIPEEYKYLYKLHSRILDEYSKFSKLSSKKSLVTIGENYNSKIYKESYKKILTLISDYIVELEKIENLKGEIYD